MKKQKQSITTTSSDPLDDAFVFLKSIPDRPEYKDVNALEAYALHAGRLREFAKECDQAATPVGSVAHERFTASATQTRKRAYLCELVADGQSIQAAIATTFQSSEQAEFINKKRARTRKNAA